MNKIETFLSNLQPKIRDLTSAICTLVSLFPAMPFDNLYYRNIRKEKVSAFKAEKDNYNAKLYNLEKEAPNEPSWWLRHIPLANRSITARS